mgnify:CR=1 FL=1
MPDFYIFYINRYCAIEPLSHIIELFLYTYFARERNGGFILTHDLAIINTFVLYIGFMMAIGVYYYRRTRNMSDYFLGNRKLGAWVTSLSAEASDMSGWMLMGVPGYAYLAGLNAGWIAVGIAIGTWANWHFVAARLRKYTELANNSLTLPEFLQNRYHDKSGLLRIVPAIFILIFFVIYTSSGFVSAGRLFETVFGIPYQYAIFIGAGSVVFYTLVGGFLAGYVILLLEKVFAGLPKNLDGLKAIFLYPLFSTAIVGLVMLGMERTGRRNGSRRIICGRNLLIASVVMTVCMSAISYIGIAPIKALYVILPVLAVFYLVYHSYSTEFFVITVDCGAALGMMWLVHRALVSSNFTWMAYAVLIAAAVLTVAQIAVVHSVRGRQGKAKNTGKKAEARFSSNAFLMMTVTPILMAVLTAVVLLAPAHMLVVMGVAAAYLFVTAVYYTVKLM